MNLEDLVETQLHGNEADVPSDLRPEFDAAMAAHDAIQYALAETILVPDTSQDDRPPPELPADYKIIRELGRGGMGIVYLASQQSLGRDIAVKVLRPGEMTHSPLVRRFMEEARHLARLRHSNIVSVHEIGEAQREPYFTMDYVEGESLAAVVSRERLSPSLTLAILKQVAEGVGHAHSHGIIHRDLKPANILLDAQNHAYVTDFGLARDMTQNVKLTRSGEIMGTPVYMAPEQARGESELIGEGTDVHALGAVMYEMLTGQPPYGCDSPASVLVRLLKDDPAPLRRLDRRIPRDLETICLKALSKSPEQRYTSVGAFLEDIRRFESGEAVLARPPGAMYRGIRLAQRHWKIATAVAVTATLMLVIALAIGPQLFDKSREELIAWAEECHTEGRHDEAVRVYGRALEKSEGAERREILNKMIRCSGEIGDIQRLAAAALSILAEDANASFGKYDFLVAQAVYADVVETHPNLLASVASRSEEDHAQLEFAASRYEVFLSGPHGSDQERKMAREKLQQMQRFLDSRIEQREYVGSQSTAKQLPTGTPEELLERSKDTAASRWQRGKAAYAAGLLLEQSDDNENARPAFQQAFDLMRSVFPTYKGVSTTIRQSTARGVEHIENEECGLLRDVFGALRRLDPDVPNMLQGGFRFRIDGVEIPTELVPKLRVELYDRSITSPARNDRLLPRTVPIKNQTGWVGIADGRYRVSIRNGGSHSSADDANRLASLLELDFAGLPTEVEIKGSTLDFGIPARLCREITLLEPANHATIDLGSRFFRWSKIEGADHYKMVIVRKESRVGEGRFFTSGASIQVSTNSLCLDTLPEVERRRAKELTPGTTAIWKVHAYDAQGRRLGTSVQADRTFLVGSGIANDGK